MLDLLCIALLILLAILSLRNVFLALNSCTPPPHYGEWIYLLGVPIFLVLFGVEITKPLDHKLRQLAALLTALPCYLATEFLAGKLRQSWQAFRETRRGFSGLMIFLVAGAGWSLLLFAASLALLASTEHFFVKMPWPEFFQCMAVAFLIGGFGFMLHVLSSSEKPSTKRLILIAIIMSIGFLGSLACAHFAGTLRIDP